MITKTILFATCSLLMVSALAEPVIPEHYDSAPNSSPEALQLVKRCQPERSESAYLQMVKDVEKYERAINLANPRELNQPYLVVNPKKTFCIPMSEKKFPILAQETFDNTIEFPGMSDSETRRLRVFLAQQIAGGDVIKIVFLDQKLGLSPLPCSGRAEQRNIQHLSPRIGSYVCWWNCILVYSDNSSEYISMWCI